MSIFKANDIRGVYGKELQDEDAYMLGNAFVRFTKSKKIIVGRDNRLSSPVLHSAVLQGVTDAGADVIDIGIIDSPGAYFASHHFKLPLIMITASHNPASHNGFYLCDRDAISIYQDNGLPKLQALMKSGKHVKSKKRGRVIPENIFPRYITHILSLSKIKKMRPLYVVIDAGNGVGAGTVERLLTYVPWIKATRLFFQSDGRFPNRAPDTSIEENLVKLGKKVKQMRTDFGIAFDGDADRVAFVDERGRALEGSLVGALLAQTLLQDAQKKETVIYTIGCSRVVPEIIHAYNGVGVREKVGHSFVNAHMRNARALFGIEHTGHYFYRDNFSTESAMATFLLMCKLVSAKQQPISALIQPLQRYYMAKEVSIPVKDQEAVLSRLKKELRAYNTKIDTFDGLSLDCGSYWFRIRASQTEALIRFVIEGEDKKEVEKQRERLTGIIKRTINGL